MIISYVRGWLAAIRSISVTVSIVRMMIFVHTDKDAGSIHPKQVVLFSREDPKR